MNFSTLDVTLVATWRNSKEGSRERPQPVRNVRGGPSLESVSARPRDAEAIVRRHQQALWRYVRHLGCDREAAADLAQDAFVVLLSGPPLASDAAQFAFLRSTARNLWRNWLRAQRRRPIARGWADAVDQLWDAAPAEPDGRLHRLLSCLDELGPRARRGVELFYERGLSRSEVAAQMALSEDGVKSLLRRTRRALAACMSLIQEVR